MPTDRPSLLSPASPTQLVLAVGEGWDDSAATLQCFVSNPAGQGWRPATGAVPAVLGRAGMAAGGGLPLSGRGPAKREGDGRAPAGVFPITALFGNGEAASEVARCARLPFFPATPDLKCVDDPASRHYNRLVDRTQEDQDWQSCEDMLRSDGRYEIGAVVGYNCQPVAAGAGSCIFLHVWQAPGVPTAGCTALARADMLALARWLDGALAPVLVQLPRSIYESVRQDWGLPAIGG